MNESGCITQACCADSGLEIKSDPSDEPRADLPPSIIGEIETPADSVPRVSSLVSVRDKLGMWKVRWGIGRRSYTVNPGLYAVGQPNDKSEVLITANYRMTFDLLRRALYGIDAWILVLDTQGINVWCAAGKGTFGTDELVDRIRSSHLSDVVSHRRLIVPQLGAPGIAAHLVRERTDFKVLYGPVEVRDIPAYLDNGRKATAAMRRKEFPLKERAAVVPMELIPAMKWVIPVTLAVALTSGLFGKGAFLADALHYGSRALLALVFGTAAGAVATPLLLPWLPGRAFAFKGALSGGIAALMIPFFISATRLELTAWILFTISLSSFLAMNFTGSSTYTSLSGVKKEMREAVPFQVTTLSVGVVLLFTALFTGGGGM